MHIKLKNILRKFGFKFPLLLSEVDNMGIEEIDGLKQELIYNFEFVKEVNNFICPDCNIGECKLVVPEVLMNGLKLAECNNCGNRRYKDFSFINLNQKENKNATTNSK